LKKLTKELKWSAEKLQFTKIDKLSIIEKVKINVQFAMYNV